MKKRILLTGLTLTTIVGLSACGQPGNGTNSSSASTPNPSISSVSSQNQHADVKHVKVTMTISPDGPKYIPANVTLPTGAIVDLKIIDKDDGAATIPAGYNKVKGTVGGVETVNGKSVTEFDAKKVAHTLTVSSINLNVPIPPSSTVLISFKTPDKPQSLMWQCFAACGSGTSGWSGVMTQMGAMKGMFTVKA